MYKVEDTIKGRMSRANLTTIDLDIWNKSRTTSHRSPSKGRFAFAIDWWKREF